METIDIQNRSFVVRWVKCSHGDTINYQVKPLKKSIDLGIYKKLKTSIDDQTPGLHIAPDTKAALDFTNKAVLHRNNSICSNGETHSRSSLSIANIQQQSQEKPLRDRLQASGFTLVKWIGHIAGNTMYQGDLEVMDSDYYYAFILDNTASKNVKKKILFNASALQTDIQSIHSNHSGSTPLLNSLKPALTNQRDSVFVVGQGRYIQGYLSKKRRKRLQGFKRRFFTLDFRYGTLSYYLNDHNQTRRGEIVIKLSTVSANKKDRLIIIDSGMEIWALKSKDVNSWHTWVQALQSCFEQNDESDSFISDELANTISENEGTIVTANDVISERLSKRSKSVAKSDVIARPSSRLTDISSYVPLPNEAYEDFSANLLLIQQRLEQYKNDSLSYTLIDPEPTFGDIRRSNSASSSLRGRGRIRGMTASSPMDSAESLINPSESAIPENTCNEHDLYNNLAELEELFNQFVKQSKVLYRDHNILTKQINGKRLSIASSSLSDNDMFYDAEDRSTIGVILLDDEDADVETQIDGHTILGSTTVESSEIYLPERQMKDSQLNPETQNTLSTIQSGKVTTDASSVSSDLYPLPLKPVSRRDDITICNSYPQSLLSFLRKNVGKDLTSITMPVTSNEPISILQTISESFEYANILPQLADPKSQFEPLAVVSAFAISSLSIYRDRTRSLRKPFNPLLGETYELVREDMGFRLIAEKVSHKPQIFAFHAEHNDWECSYTVTPVQKFWGKSIELNNEGTFELKSKKSGEYFEWVQPTTMVKNLIAGERYVEPTNEIEVISSKSGKAIIAFEKTGMFSGRSEAVTVDIISSNKSGKNQSLIGKWTDSLKDKKTGKTIWKVGDTVKKPKEKYGFTKFTANLNEITSIEKDKLPPTDSRLRPDIRFYEQGKVDEAEKSKLELEQKQRERRQTGKDVKPRYFKKDKTNKWIYIDGPNSYWEKRKRQEWTDSPVMW